MPVWEQHKRLRRGPSSQEDKFQQMEVPMQMKKCQTTVESNEFLIVICDVKLRWSTKKVLTGTYQNSDKQPGSPPPPTLAELLRRFPLCMKLHGVTCPIYKLRCQQFTNRMTTGGLSQVLFGFTWHWNLFPLNNKNLLTYLVHRPLPHFLLIVYCGLFACWTLNKSTVK